MVESNSNRFRSPSVFKTVQGPALITFHDLIVDWESNPTSCDLDLAWLGSWSNRFIYKLEHRVRFELTALRICNPFHWASLAPVHNWRPRMDLNHRHLVLETNVLPD